MSCPKSKLSTDKGYDFFVEGRAHGPELLSDMRMSFGTYAKAGGSCVVSMYSSVEVESSLKSINWLYIAETPFTE